MSRLRKIPNADALIQEYKELLKNHSQKINKGILEIGCGKGQWLYENAIKNPKKQYYGMEKDKTIVLKLLRKIYRFDIRPNNLHIICDDANNIKNWITKIDTICIHFPDPWPKKRHTEKRLVHRRFLQIYSDLLNDDGQIIFKTDQKNLYDFLLNETNYISSLQIKTNMENIYNNSSLSSEILTEYETKFVSRNLPIYKIIINKK